MHLRRFFARRALRIQAGILATNTWNTRTLSANINLYGLCWSPELEIFVSVFYNHVTIGAATSPDGITWTTAGNNLPAYQAWYSVCWSAELGIFVAVCHGGTYACATSPDGINWTNRTGSAGLR